MLRIIWTGIIILRLAICQPDIITHNVFIATVMEDELLIACGGSILSPRTVLTSAHCLFPPLQTYIFVGSQHIELNLAIEPTPESDSRIIKVTKTILHEKFRNISKYDYDVALASFDEELAFGDTVSPIQLAPYWARLNDLVYMFGWGQSSSGNYTNYLSWTPTMMVCRSKGKDLAQPGAWDNLIISTDGVLFVKGHELNDSLCYGMTGSPLVVRNLQIGISSFGVDYGCQGLVAISSIRRHIRWIEKSKALLEGKNAARSQGWLGKRSHRKKTAVELSAQKASGIRTTYPISTSRIRNGSRIVSPETYPFLVGVATYISDDPAHFELPLCTGSILTQWIVLTAAHCTNFTISKVLVVYAGVIDMLSFTEPGAQAVRVDLYRNHPQYNETNKVKYDIALLLLSAPLKFSARVASVCQLALENPKVGTSVYLAGWGRLAGGVKPTYSSWAMIPVKKSPSWYNLTDVFLLDTATGPSGCSGDSGGPYFNAEHEISGVHAFSYGDNKSNCNAEGTAAMSVAWYYTWVVKTTLELEENATMEEQE